MKKAGVLMVLFLMFILFANLIHAQDATVPTVIDEDQMNQILDNIPIDDSGNLDKSKAAGFSSKIAERLEFLDAVTKPLTKALFGIELKFASWTFAFAILIWIAVIIILASLGIDIFNFNPLLSFVFSLVISSLLMRVFGKLILGFLETLFIIWWASLIFCVGIIIVLFIYKAFMKAFGDKLREKKKEEEEQRREQKQETLEKVADIKLKASGRI